MTEITGLAHYLTVAFAVGLPAVGVGIGQGWTTTAALDAINRQPSAKSDIVKVAIFGMALIETAAVMGAFVSMLILYNNWDTPPSYYASLSSIGVFAAISIPGFVLGLVSAMPARAACFTVARQPFFTQKILRFMVLTMSLIQTPVIFGFIISLIISGQAQEVTTMRDCLRLIASGISIGLGSVGPAIGLGLFARSVCLGLGINRKAYDKIFSFTLISQAIIETPIIFALVISVMLLFIVPPLAEENLIDGIALLSAGLCAGLGTIGAGISSGRTAAAAGTRIAHTPETYSLLAQTSMFAQGLIEASAIYPMIIAFALLFLR
jgi:F0F1-type ATP synthase membrane subunit c/vacuolar-type H+-ATPase subunit K